MKTFLLSVVLWLASITAYSQKNFPSQPQQPERTEPAQQPARSEYYQQPERPEPVQYTPKREPAQQQSERVEAEKKQVNTTEARNAQSGNTSKEYTEKKHQRPPGKDSLAARHNRNNEQRRNKVPESTTKQVTEQWKCPECERIFSRPGDYPPSGKCPYDGTILIRIN